MLLLTDAGRALKICDYEDVEVASVVVAASIRLDEALSDGIIEAPSIVPSAPPSPSAGF